MARVVFTSNLARHLPVPDLTVAGTTLRDVLEATFAVAPAPTHLPPIYAVRFSEGA